MTMSHVPERLAPTGPTATSLQAPIDHILRENAAAIAPLVVGQVDRLAAGDRDASCCRSPGAEQPVEARDLDRRARGSASARPGTARRARSSPMARPPASSPWVRCQAPALLHHLGTQAYPVPPVCARIQRWNVLPVESVQDGRDPRTARLWSPSHPIGPVAPGARPYPRRVRRGPERHAEGVDRRIALRPGARRGNPLRGEGHASVAGDRLGGARIKHRRHSPTNQPWSLVHGAPHEVDAAVGHGHVCRRIGASAAPWSGAMASTTSRHHVRPDHHQVSRVAQDNTHRPQRRARVHERKVSAKVHVAASVGV